MRNAVFALLLLSVLCISANAFYFPHQSCGKWIYGCPYGTTCICDYSLYPRCYCVPVHGNKCGYCPWPKKCVYGVCKRGYAY
uniref:Prism uncharacterized shell protein 18 like n=1 Tax=Pinctada fucata TaxID=50426 RepID=L8B2Q5_PINFU|nr:Prism uncharacterized shell protein 18 like [Pinctada fucata]